MHFIIEISLKQYGFLILTLFAKKCPIVFILVTFLSYIV
jgi:hypothetical protein